ncbi:MAG: 50S ribosomal protein L13 [archaeon]
MKVIDGEGAVLGRLASYAAKEALKGEEIIVLNSEKIIITGSKKWIEGEFTRKRQMAGTSQKGPRHSRPSYMIVKRTIRGMLPDHRTGTGRDAFKRIKCYVGFPEEFKDKKTIKIVGKEKNKFIKVEYIAK